METPDLSQPASSPARPNLLRAWWPAVVWIGLIGVESTDWLSSNNTGSLLYDILVRIYPRINLYDVLVLNFYMRKTGHVVGYGMLSLLLLRAWRATLAHGVAVGRSIFGSATFLRAALFAWLGTAFVASMDEWHQTFIPSRTGSVYDVLLDSAAGFVSLLIAYFWLRRLNSPSLRPKT